MLTHLCACLDEMQEWGRAKMRMFQNSDDLTLIKWLMTLRSAGEVADYVNTYFPNHPAAPNFIAEFLRCVSLCLVPWALCNPCLLLT